MILTFYDKDYTALQDNASLNVGNWDLKRRAVDFDEFSAESERFTENINPTFVVMKDDRGRYKYAAFAGIPELNKANQTSINASDFKTIHNNDVLLNFPTYTTENYLNAMFSYILEEFYSQVIQESFEVDYDLTDVASIKFKELIPEPGHQVYNLWEDILAPYMKFYGLYMTSKLDIKNKKLLFTIARVNQYDRPLNLYETEVKNYGKWIASVNETQYVIKTPSKLVYSPQYILNSQNEIGTLGNITRDLYPIKKRIVLKECDSDQGSEDYKKQELEALEECLTDLIDAKYNESLEFDVTNTSYEKDFFSTIYSIYLEKGTLYKKLPLGEICEDNTGTKKFTLGYKKDDVILYI